jgi:putative hydrolase of the HAD superfamily
MTKLIFDLDGVVITYEKNFAEAYSAEFGVDTAKIYEFFSNDYYACAIGQASLRDKIEKYIPLWEWQGDAESLIQYWFEKQSKVDTRLLDLIDSARQSGHKCYVASDQDETRSAYVRKLVNVDDAFDGSFFSCDMGITKTEVAFFERMLAELGNTLGDVYFWDDNPKNVKVAKHVGIRAEVYNSFEEFQPMFSSQFISDK